MNLKRAVIAVIALSSLGLIDSAYGMWIGFKLNDSSPLNMVLFTSHPLDENPGNIFFLPAPFSIKVSNNGPGTVKLLVKSSLGSVSHLHEKKVSPHETYCTKFDELAKFYVELKNISRDTGSNATAVISALAELSQKKLP
jgi:hypothetical protein